MGWSLVGRPTQIMNDEVVYQKGWEWLRFRKAPGIAGVSDGPGSCNNEFIFDRPDPSRDIPRTLKMMEEAGKLKDPETLAMAQLKMEEAKSIKPGPTADYQKEGHPLDI